MEDFYKNIKDNINQRPEPSFDKGAWKAMDKKLGRKSRMIPLAYLGWAAIPLALLLGTNIFWYNEARSFQQGPVITHQTDTLYIYKTTTKVDTVYISNQVSQRNYNFRNPTKISPSSLREIQNLKGEVNQLRKQLSMVNTAYNSLLSDGRDMVSSRTPEQITNEIESLKLKRDLFAEVSSEGTNKMNSNSDSFNQPFEKDIKALSESDNTFEKPSKTTSTTPESHIVIDDSVVKKSIQVTQPNTVVISSKNAVVSEENSKETSEIAIDLMEEEVKEPSVFDKLLEEISTFSVRDVYLGIGTGLYYPQFDKGNYTIGQFFELNALLPLSEHFQAESSFSYNNVLFEGNNASDLGIDPIEVPFDNVVLLKVEAPTVSYRFDLGLQYAMNTKHKVQPKLGLGYGLQYFSVSEYQYEYQDIETGIQLDVEENALIKEFRGNSLLIKPGIDYQINDKLLLNLQSMYRSILGKQDFLSSDFWSVGLSIKYKI